MKSVHDLAGTEGLGPVAPTKELEELVFCGDWERAVFAMLVPPLLAGINLDKFRHGIERMHPRCHKALTISRIPASGLGGVVWP